MVATRHAVTFEIPSDLYERLQQAAKGDDRTVETVMIESLKAVFGTLSVDDENDLRHYSDEQLWAVVYQCVSRAENERMRELAERGKQTTLTPDEQAELESLIDEVDEQMLLRSQALLLLKQRGYEIGRRLKFGT